MKDMSMVRGTTRRIRHDFWQPRSSPKLPRIPYVLAGSTLTFTVRNLDTGELVAAKTIGAGIEVPAEPVNTAFSILSPADTDELPAPVLLAWDLELTTPQGEVYQADYGRILIHPDQTRT